MAATALRAACLSWRGKGGLKICRALSNPCPRVLPLPERRAHSGGRKAIPRAGTQRPAAKRSQDLAASCQPNTTSPGHGTGRLLAWGGAFSVPGLERQLPSPLPPRSPASFAPRSNRGGKRVCRAALPRREGRGICPRSRSKSSPLPTIAPELHQKKGKRGTWAPAAGRVPRTLTQACFQHSPQLASFWLEATSGFRGANPALEVSALFLFSSPPQLLLLTCLFPSSLYPLHPSPSPAQIFALQHRHVKPVERLRTRQPKGTPEFLCAGTQRLHVLPTRNL